MRFLVVAMLLSAGQAGAEVPEAYTRAWSAMRPRIDANIERWRKADATVEIVDAGGKPIAGAKVDVRQQTHEFLFGSNLFALGQLATPELNRKYEAAFAGLLNFATLPFYWREIEPEPGKLRFTEGSEPIWRRPPPDVLLRWCQAHGITAKGHALMYVKTKFMPDWVPTNDPQRLKAIAEKHMAEIAARYGKEIRVWDVVNEEIPRHRNPHEWNAVPDDYLAWCFQEAGRLLPKEDKLLLNDGTSQAHITTEEYEGLIKGLLERKVRIEGIGIQFHTSRDAMLRGKLYPPDQLYAVYDRLGRLGLPLWITEITIPGTGEDGPAQQAVVVENLYRLWFSAPAMAGVTWWNLADGTAYGNENKALGGLLDKDMNPKPAYRALERLIHHEWKTGATMATGADGQARWRGFRGKYRVTVTAGGKSQEFEVVVGKAGASVQRLICR